MGRKKMDPLSNKDRSALMGRVKSSMTRPERRLSQELDKLGLSAAPSSKPLPGSPDFAMDTAKVAVFVDGCFWHGCPCCFRRPKSNSNYWREKIDKNRYRDKAATEALEGEGWFVLRFWEHELKGSGVSLAAQRVAEAVADRES